MKRFHITSTIYSTQFSTSRCWWGRSVTLTVGYWCLYGMVLCACIWLVLWSSLLFGKPYHTPCAWSPPSLPPSQLPRTLCFELKISTLRTGYFGCRAAPYPRIFNAERYVVFIACHIYSNIPRYVDVDIVGILGKVFITWKFLHLEGKDDSQRPFQQVQRASWRPIVFDHVLLWLG